MAPSARLVIPWLGLSTATLATTSQTDLSDEASLLQTSGVVSVTRETSEPLCAPIRKYYNGNQVVAEYCGPWNSTNPSWWGPRGPQQARDLDRPLADVQREHPGNLYPYFGTLNGWMSGTMDQMVNVGYGGYQRAMGFNNPLPVPRPRPITYTWDSFQITTHLDTCSAADDPYCYSLGWMQGQALDQKYNMRMLMDDFTAWNNLGVEECRRMKEEFDFKDEDITLGGHIRETNEMYLKIERTCNWHRPDPGPPATVRDFKKHAYAKCFMNNVTTEMAFCYFKGCVLENNMIGHSTECAQ